MGAQGSSHGIDGLALRQDSRGQAIIPYASAKEIEAIGLARIAELESELAETHGRLEQREEELDKTQRLLCKLEGAVEQQAKDSELEQHRISQMETTLARQHTGTEEKVAKLLLAVAGEKQRAELAEKACEEAVQNAAAEVAQLKMRIEEEEGLRSTAEKQADELRERLMDAEAEVRNIKRKQGELSDTESSQIVRELQNQLSDEVSKRMEVQNRLLEKDRRLREAQEELSKISSKAMSAIDQGNRGVNAADKEVVVEFQSRLAAEESMRKEAEGKLMDKDLQVKDLQQKLADELKSRMTAQQQVAERERQLSNLQMAFEGDDLSQKQAMQTQVIEKTREACELQQQLTDELSKRQEVQYQLLQSQRQVCEMQQQVLGRERVHTMPGTMPRMLELATAHEEEEMRDEPDDEKSPRSSHSTERRDRFVDDFEFKRGSTPNSMQLSPGQGGSFTAAPPPSARWGMGILSWMPGGVAVQSPAPMYRTNSGTPTVMESFVRNYTPPAMAGTAATNDAVSLAAAARGGTTNGSTSGATSGGTSGGASMRNRMYLSQGTPGSGCYPVGTAGLSKSALEPTNPRRSSPSRGGQTNHNRRLILASRTFT